MWPRLAVFIAPIDTDAGTYRVRVVKGWWKGPGTGGVQAILFEGSCDLKSTSERERIAEALRAAADAL